MAARAGGAFGGEAIQHALAAGEPTLAAELIKRYAPDMIMQGKAKTVHTWVEALPEERIALGLRTYLLWGAYAQAAPYLARAADLPAPGADA